MDQYNCSKVASKQGSGDESSIDGFMSENVMEEKSAKIICMV